MSQFRAVNASLNSKSIPGSMKGESPQKKTMPLGKVLLIHEHRLKVLETKISGGIENNANGSEKTIELLQAKLSVLEEKFATLEEQLSNQPKENIVELEVEEN